MTMMDESKNPERVKRVEGHQESSQKWFVYIAEARTGRFYTGITTDPKKRIEKHNTGKGARFALQQGPFKLAYISSSFSSKSHARIREIQVKGWSREKKKKLIEGEYQ